MAEHKFIEFVIRSDKLHAIRADFWAMMKKRSKEKRSKENSGGFAALIDAAILELPSRKGSLKAGNNTKT